MPCDNEAAYLENRARQKITTCILKTLHLLRMQKNHTKSDFDPHVKNIVTTCSAVGLQVAIPPALLEDARDSTADFMCQIVCFTNVWSFSKICQNYIELTMFAWLKNRLWTTLTQRKKGALEVYGQLFKPIPPHCTAVIEGTYVIPGKISNCWKKLLTGITQTVFLWFWSM